MAQNITLLGAQYEDVPSVTLPKTGGGIALFTDVSDTTSQAADVLQGTYFYDANGVRTEGTNSGGGTPLLPVEYQQVEYLRSSNNQYIDTGVIPDNNTRIQIKCQNLVAADDDVILGGSSGTNTQTWIADATGMMKYTYRMGANVASGKTFNSVDPHVVDFNDDQDRLMVNGENILSLTSKYTSTPRYNLYMFAGNNNGSPTYFTTAFIWYCKIINKADNSLIRDFYPCYRKADSKPGMYDLANNVFYVNQRSGADFTVGQDIN